MSSIWDDVLEAQRHYYSNGCDSLNMGPDRASHRMHPCFNTPDLRGAIWYLGREIAIYVMDVSLSGLSICGTLEDLCEGADVVLAVQFEKDQPVIIPCEVTRANGKECSMRFITLEPGQVRALFSYIHNLAFSNDIAVIEPITARAAA